MKPVPETATPAFVLKRPVRQAGPLIFASPHSGRDYPADFLARVVFHPRTNRLPQAYYRGTAMRGQGTRRKS